MPDPVTMTAEEFKALAETGQAMPTDKELSTDDILHLIDYLAELLAKVSAQAAGPAMNEEDVARFASQIGSRVADGLRSGIHVSVPVQAQASVGEDVLRALGGEVGSAVAAGLRSGIAVDVPMPGVASALMGLVTALKEQKDVPRPHYAFDVVSRGPKGIRRVIARPITEQEAADELRGGNG